MNRPLEELVRRAASGQSSAVETRAAARLMTLLEQDPRRLPELFQHHPLSAWPTPRLVLGVTGAPGSGKSSLTDALVREFRDRTPRSRIGVIAVDPSSPFTGGAVLGDRVRMMRHATDPLVFIRSLATRGHLGGLSLGVRGVLRVMGLIGCETVIIETVGVGQSEVEIARIADLVMIVLAPGHGDSIQLLKAGLMEVGDAFVVNKADRDGASQLYAALLSSLSLGGLDPTPHDDAPAADHHAPLRVPEHPRAFLVSATEETGMKELVDHLDAESAAHQAAWRLEREQRVLVEVEEAVLEDARQRVQDVARSTDFEAILSGNRTVSEVARDLQERSLRGEAASG